MATTKKSTKGRKKSRKYMKRAARRTLAALLMITALIVAAIPATPGRAAATPDLSGVSYSYSISMDNIWLYLKDADHVTVEDGHALQLVGVSRVDESITNDFQIELPRDFVVYSGYPATSENAIEHCKVVEIGDDAIGVYSKGKPGVRSISENLTAFIGYDVQRVGNKSFQDCSKMSNCRLGDLNWVGDYAFQNCDLTSFPITNDSHIEYIGNYAFSGTRLTSAKIPGPSGSQSARLGDNVYYNCPVLSTAEFTGNFDSIGSYTFANCPEFTGVISWPSGLTQIGDHTFSSCSGNFTGIELPNTINVMGDYTFEGCSKLTRIRVSDQISSLPDNTFAGCSGLLDVNIPGRVSSLKTGLLSDCSSLTYVHLNNTDKGAGTSAADTLSQNIIIQDGAFPASVSTNDAFTVYGYRYYDATGHGNKTFSEAYKHCIQNNIRYICIIDGGEDGFADEYYDIDSNHNIVNVLVDKILDAGSTGGVRPKYIQINKSILDSDGNQVEIEGIYGNSFKNTSGLEGVILQDNIKRVYPNAFSDISSLQYVEFANPNTTAIEDTGSQDVFPANSGFYIRGEIALDTAGDGKKNAYEYASQYDLEFRGAVTDEGVTNTLVIKKDQTLYGFEQNGRVENNMANLPNPISYIFIPEGVTRIEDDLLKDYDALTKLKSEGIEYIADSQFKNCDGLVDVSFDSKLKDIGTLPFELCDNLKKISITDSPFCSSDETYGVIYAPVSSWSGSEIDIPNFRIVEALEANDSSSYSIPSDINGRTVDEIDDRAFQRRMEMKTFDSRNGNVETIPENCFDGDESLTTIYLGSSVKKVESHAFQDMGNHDSVKKTPKIRAYNKYIELFYKDSDNIFNHTNSTNDIPYYFYSVEEGDNVYTMCDQNKNDNLIWVARVDEDEPVDLQNCEIIIREGHSPKTLPSDGSAVTWEAGDADNGDFYVRYKVSDGVYKTLIANTDYSFRVLNDLTKIGTKEFSVDGISDKYTGTNKSSFEVIQSGGGTDYNLSDYDIVFPKGDIPYTGNIIEIVPLDEAKPKAESNYGEFYVIGRESPYKVLREGVDYYISGIAPNQVKNIGKYTLTITGIRDYSGSKDQTFMVTDGSTPPLPENVKLNEIRFPENAGGQIRYYDGHEYTFTAGYDYDVYDTNGELVPPAEYELIKGNLTGITGDPNKTIEVPFTVSTNAVSSYYPSSVANKFFIKPSKDNDGPFTIKLPGIDELGFAEWTGAVIEPEPVVYSKTDASTLLEVIKDYTVGYPNPDASSGPNNRDMGTNKGIVYIYGTGTYKDQEGLRYFNIRKSIPYYVTSDDNRKKITFTVTNGRYYTGEGEIKVDEDVDDSTTKKEEGKYSKGTVNADVVLTDATTGKKLVEGVDYTLSYKKEKGMNGTVTVTGMGNYFGSYTSAKFPLKKESKSSSSSSGGGSSSNSSSNKSSSSSSRSSSSSMGGSSSSSGTGSSSGANRNSGTTVINRNYYGPNGGTVDELQDMLRAAHIDSINGGTADGYQVNITKSDAAEQAFRDALIRRYGSLDNIRYFSMDISVRDQNGNPIDTSGMSVTLTLPLPTSMQQYGTNNKIATVDSGGDLEDLNEQFSTLEGRPCVTFVAPHFSPYGFYVNTADLAIGTLDNTPKTGDPIHPKWFLSFGLAALSIFLFLKRDPKPRVSAA